MPTLSVVMIVKDEAACLGDCLDSVRAIADEIVVADTGSTDDTVAIAQRFGAHVLQVPWHDDFAAARNQSLADATGDWLLHLDADEVLDAQGAARIRAIVDADGAGAHGDRADAIEVTLANYCDAVRAWRWMPVAPDDPMARGHAGYIAVGLLRLFRNHRGFEYREPVHENITESVRDHGGVIRAEPIVIHHYGFAGDPEKGRTKARAYFAIAKRKAAQRPEDPKSWCDLAEQAFACGDAATAEDAARKALDIEPLNLAATTMLANLWLNRGDLDDARALLERLEAANVAPPHVVTALAAVACRQGRLDEARRRLEAVLDAQPNAIQARLYLARTLDRLGDTAAAHEQLQQAAATAPRLQELQDRLEAHQLRQAAEAQYQARDLEAALATLVRALELDPEDPLTHNDLGVVLTALQQPAKARRAFERALRLAPAMPEAADNLAALTQQGGALDNERPSRHTEGA